MLAAELSEHPCARRAADPSECSGCITECDDFGCYQCCWSCNGSSCEQSCNF
ncbi:MAG: hypothetical protein K1X88_08585 [Nannocystaceae bacterium]|nr:hypothetical protein [Nannocystaceae bacterium]